MDTRHEISLSGRQELKLTGVAHVEHYDSREIVLTTSLGLLVVSGEDLNIDHLNIEEGRLEVRGQISALVYEDHQKGSGRGRSLLQRLWR